MVGYFLHTFFVFMNAEPVSRRSPPAIELCLIRQLVADFRVQSGVEPIFVFVANPPN